MAGKAGRNRFTLIVVPHSAEPTVSCNLSVRTLQVLAAVLIIFWIGLLVFANSYYALAQRSDEIWELRTVNKRQKLRIRELAQEVQSISAELEYLAELDSQVRELARLDEFPQSVSMSLDEEHLGRLVKLAGLDGATTVQYALGGGGEIPHEAAGALRDVHLLRQDLAAMREQLLVREESLENLRANLAKQQAFVAARPDLWPVNGIVTSKYGYRRSPFGGGRQFHAAVDIAAPYGSPIVATGDGRVVFSGWKGAYGRTVIIDHGYGFVTVYGHQSKNVVGVGDSVRKGQIIGYVGSSGRSTGPHVHYEIRKDGRTVDPMTYMTRRTD